MRGSLAVPSTSTMSAVPPPAQLGSAQAGGGVLIATLLTSAVVAAVIGAFLNIFLSRRKSLEEERARVRTACAEAFEAVAAYKEFPYAIRRRRADNPEEERVRLSEELRHVQARLSYYTTWMVGESAAVGSSYGILVAHLRQVAGTACHDAWLASPAHQDSDMNIPAGVVDLSGIGPYEDAYITAARVHLDSMLRLRRLLSRR